MNPSRNLSGNRRLQTAIGFYRRFWRACEAFAAAEFAMIAPIMITMYFGAAELTDGYAASAKVTSVASTAADLVAQENSICNAEMADTFSALDAIIFPYDTQKLK